MKNINVELNTEAKFDHIALISQPFNTKDNKLIYLTEQCTLFGIVDYGIDSTPILTNSSILNVRSQVIMQFSPNSANFTAYPELLSGLGGFNLVNNGLSSSGNLIIGANNISAIYDGELDANYPTTSTLFNMAISDIGEWNNGDNFIPFSKLQLNVKHEETSKATKPQLMISQFQDESSGSDWCGIFHRFSYNNSANEEDFSSAVGHYEIRPIGTSNVAYSFGSNTNVNNSKNGFILGGYNNNIFNNNRLPGNTLLPGNSEGCFILNSVNSKIYEGSSANSFIEHRMHRNGIVRRISK